jgi:aryl-alcohol dehydrogenase-like predicted oxidoreductase
MVKAGYVRHIGLSEVGAETIQRAAAVHPIVDVQIEYALISRGPEAKIFPLLEKLGIAATTYGTLSRGLLTQSPMQAKGDYRNLLPRFTGDNLARNQQLAEKLKEIAASKSVSPAQLAIAWALAKQPFVIPVIGARTRAQLAESLGALEVHLSAGEMAALESAVPADAVAGTRYGEDQMKHLDSEK